MSEAVGREEQTASKPDALRRAWYRLVIAIGYRDMAGVEGERAEDLEEQRGKGEEEQRGGVENLVPSPPLPLSPSPLLPSTPRPPAQTPLPSLRFSARAQTTLAEAAGIASEIALEPGITEIH
jgi:hypothetical protein